VARAVHVHAPGAEGDALARGREDRGQVEDHLGLRGPDRVVDLGLDRHVALVPGDPLRQGGGGLREVEAGDLVAAREEEGKEIGADLARRTRDQDPHASTRLRPRNREAPMIALPQDDRRTFPTERPVAGAPARRPTGRPPPVYSGLPIEGLAMPQGTAQDSSRKTVLSLVRATGQGHLGNYLGAYRQMAELSARDDRTCFYGVADLHTLTTHPNPAEIRRYAPGIVLDILASGSTRSAASSSCSRASPRPPSCSGSCPA
jgi:hypothetical protein